MRNFKIVLSYDGSEFSGWQIQPDAATIQGTLASAIGRVTGEKVLPQGSGRTDAGVHALAQVASFALESPIPPQNLVKALNDMLPPSIRVIEATEAPLEFHARKSAHAKTYHYRIHRGAVCPPFLAHYVWHYPYPLDEDAMGRAAAFVIGEHDFTSFAAVDSERGREDEISDVRSNVRRVFALNLGAHRRGIAVRGPGQRVLAPHGQKPRGDVRTGWKRYSETGGCVHHSGSAKAISRGSNCSCEWAVSGECRILGTGMARAPSPA